MYGHKKNLILSLNITLKEEPLLHKSALHKH